ncbi:MAG TPA: DUF1573 domain-containing protein [Thermoanaerobaculia bacterium]|nr:DUF1573 domain-containing protein [Thermoanaerobaculia bacterium]
MGFLLASAALGGELDGLPRAALVEPDHDFGEVRLGQTVSHDFLVRNEGKGVLKLERAELSLPNMSLRSAPIEPESEGRVHIELKTAGLAGKVEAQALLFFNDPGLPRGAVLTLRGRVHPPLELRPFGAVFLAAFKDEPVEKVLTLVNNEEKPIEVKQVRSDGSHFVSALKTVEPGKTFDVTVRVVPGTPVGRYEEALVIEMSSPPGRVLRVPVHLFVKPDLYATPDAVDFGEVPLEQLRRSAGMLEMLKQTVLVTSRRDQFSLRSVVCDLPGVTIRQVPPSGPSKTFRIEGSPNPDRLERGPLRGALVVKTSDEELPELKIPVEGVAR